MNHDAPPPKPGLAVLVQQPGAPDARVHHGLANLELSAPIGPGTTFNAGSLGKQITAHLVVLAARQGLLGLDRPVSAFLPRFRLTSVTVADLVRHQGGVRDAESLLSLAGLRDLDHYTSHDLLELAFRQTRRCTEPGRFLYSNTGYLLLAAVLRTVHGTDLTELAGRQVFAPLEMTSARFVPDPLRVVPGAASSYAPTPDGWVRCQRPVALPGPGTLWCSTTDLGRWLTHLWETWPTARRLVHDQDIPYCPSDHPPHLYGPGLYADPRRPGDEAVFHYGHEQGFSAAALLFRSGLRVVCLSNHAAVHAGHVADRIIKEFRSAGCQLDALQRIVEGARAAGADGKPPQPGPDHRSDHTALGTYTCADVPGALRLTVADGRLFLWRRGTSDLLVPDGPATFHANGLRLVAPHPVDPTTLRPGHPEHFTLHLDRAPDLRYHRTTS
ncbi:beta-lactamase family protein [Streptomyces sp. AV19]|uniref:serine hydrolase domain-containing protein n=1 Tax=Streptomyces sp. AV19 TaxID=2793068 RepID=UPI0018FE717B|nr:serine hydrolase domain-containing protein [Streptomyces sp. AV19]MBH1937466.1 beta-lactamase family protein [Streptomyces sp. AV19]MDG4533761.1 beta-lactamase family protein [Streptomyces sp. AV19]